MRKRTAFLFGTAVMAAVLLCGCNKGSDGSAAGVDSSVPNGESEGIADELFKEIGRATLAQSADFHEDIAGTVGDHIYYSSNLFEGRGYSSAEEKEMLKYLEEVDATLDEDLYITGHTTWSETGEHKFYARQYINGAVAANVFYVTDWDKPSPNIVYAADSSPSSPLSDLDTSKAISPEVLFATVKEEAEKNSDKLGGYYSDKGVYGTYLLSYDPTMGGLVYDFRVNEYSQVVFNAKTGELVYENFWDGAIDD